MLKFVTFNIRCDFNQDGENSFCHRKALILTKIHNESPDIICFQEVLPHVALWLKEVLKDYYVIGCGRSEALEDEQVSIAYKKAAFNLISMETFWLSDEPYLPASRYSEQSACPRVCTEVLLEDLAKKQAFRIFNIHLDHIGVQARTSGLLQILKKADEVKLFPKAPVILAGDFNEEPDTGVVLLMNQHTEYKNITQGIGVTYHGFEPGEKQECIDYIFIRQPQLGGEGLYCQSISKWEDRKGNIWLSDHYPICASLEWATPRDTAFTFCELKN